MKKVGDREYESVLKLPAMARYSHFVRQVADWGQLWTLRSNDGWVLGAADDGLACVPVWPHARYASACAVGEWAATSPDPIDLPDWLDKWTPGMIRDHRLVAVFPTPIDKAVMRLPELLLSDLHKEMKNYE